MEGVGQSKSHQYIVTSQALRQSALIRVFVTIARPMGTVLYDSTYVFAVINEFLTGADGFV